MKRITILGCFVGLLSLSVNAQFIQSSTSDSKVRTTDIENQTKPKASVQELLQRYQNLGKQSGAISEYFTKEEQRIIQNYLALEKSGKRSNLSTKAQKKSSSVDRDIRSLSTNGNYGYTNNRPLFLASEILYAGVDQGIALPTAYYNSTFTAINDDISQMRSSTSFNPYNLSVPFTGTYGNPSNNAIASLLYDNGPFINQPGTPDLSVLQGSLAMSTLGAGVQFTAGNSIADEVIFTQDAEITSLDAFVYQTNTAAPSITGMYMRVWNGDPSSGTATVVWGDLTTNIIGGNTGINGYRVSETTLTNRSREIQKVTATTTALTLTAGTYWFEYSFEGSGSSGPWAVPITINGQATTGNALQNINGAWQAWIDTGSNTPQGLPFQIYGNFTGGGSTFPDPYCGPLTFNSDVEPITLVEVAGISNRTSGVVNGTPAHEDYTTIVGNMEEGESYPIALEGNTNGGFTASFTVFIDWNQDGILDNASERYEIGTINGSTGNDGMQAIGTITVPAGVVAGPTRMRVIKKFLSSYATDSCTPGSGYGQAEDYTIDVTLGGGSGGNTCAQTHPFSASGGGAGSSADSDFKTASDIVVTAGEDFTLETIEVPFLTFAPEDPPITATVVYYTDNAGFPGSVLGTETVVPTIVSSGVWVNPVAYQFKTSLAVTPFTFNGDATVDKTYWIQISMGTATNQTTVFWEYTNDIPVEGNPMVQFDASVGTWSVPNSTQEVIYTYTGQCETMGGGNPGPLTTVYGINNDDQDLIGFGVADPQNAEVFGTSPVTVNFENAGAIDPANPTTGYVLDNAGQFYSFDVTTGFYTLLGNIAGDWTGMEFDRTSGLLYAIKSGSLYTIDTTAMTSTLVGSMNIGTGIAISLAIDGSGVGYIHNISDDMLYSVSLTTGAATVIGATGFDANYGQGMCYDPTTDSLYMSAFNNGTFMSEWRSVNTATGMTTLIAPITTVNDPDPQMGWASVGETLDPPTCPKPTMLTVTDITETTAQLNWVEEPNASNGYVWYVFEQGADPMTATAVATGTTPSGTTMATATGLQNAMSYDFYVVADCAADGLSSYAGPVTFGTLITPPACGGKFYDTGGPDGNYGNNENVTTVISPDVPGDFVTVTFTSFNVEASWDALYVHNGPDATYPLISSGNPATNSGFPAGGYYGTTIPGPFSSTDPSGALTFVFRSESSFTYLGWEADVTCATFAPPNDKIVNSINVGDIGFPYTDPGVAMHAATPENGNPADCDLTGANGVWYHFTTLGDGTANANIVTPSGLSNVTFYTAPNENAVETDLTRVQQSSNPCNPGTSSSINTVGGQTYYVFVMNSGGRTDIQIDVTTLGVNQYSLEGFTFYPNPSTGVLNLNSNKNIEMVSIYNMVGQKVLSSTLNTSSTSLDISQLSVGTYVMKVVVNGETGTYKVIKQ